MIVVTGANGQLGQDIIRQLLDKVNADQIVASVREPQRAITLRSMGVQIRKGDFADPT